MLRTAPAIAAASSHVRPATSIEIKVLRQAARPGLPDFRKAA